MLMPGQQFRHMGGMHQDLMSAMERENYSRVAQSREARRMAEQRLRDQNDYQTLLLRLQHEREMAEKKMRYDALMREIESDKQRGVISSTKWDRELNNLFGE